MSTQVDVWQKSRRFGPGGSIWGALDEDPLPSDKLVVDRSACGRGGQILDLIFFFVKVTLPVHSISH